MMETEGVQLVIDDDAKWKMAQMATEINRDVENIGARRLHTLMERLMEDLSFEASDRSGERIVLSAEDVQKSAGELATKADLSKFLL
jgi:ATP-dependent HslUV protease ATP-binding subunit HslU